MEKTRKEEDLEVCMACECPCDVHKEHTHKGKPGKICVSCGKKYEMGKRCAHCGKRE